jgi:hypothetical protein
MFRFAIPYLFLAAAVASADPKTPTYVDDVLPILKQHCNNCHGNDKQSAGLNLASLNTLKEGGSSGEVVKAGDPDKSRLFTLTAHKEKPEMPPKAAKIPDAQIEILRLWIEQGLRENSGSKVNIPDKPKVDIGVKNVGKGRPEGPPPMPIAGKLKGDPILRTRRPGAVLAMAAAPWSPLVAVGGAKQVLLFHTDTGDLLGALPFEAGQIQSLHFSRNGKFLLAAGGRGGASGKAVLFNIETCEKVTEVGIETDAILAADVSPDQTMIAVGSPSKLIRIYNTADGSVAREIKKHTDWVTAVEFSPDGVLLASGDRNGGLFAWEAATGREFHALRGHTGMITDISWRGDANLVATSSEDGTIKLWEMENGTTSKSFNAHAGGAASVKFSHDGRLASTGRDKVVKVWDGNGGLVKQMPEAFPDLGLKVAFAHDNAKVIGGDWAGNLRVWNLEGKVLFTGDSNPMPIAERIQAAEAVFASADARQKQAQASFNAADDNAKKAAAAYAAAQANVAKLTAEIAASKTSVEQAAKAAEAAKAALPPLKAEADTQVAVNAKAQEAVKITGDHVKLSMTPSAGKNGLKEAEASFAKAQKEAEVVAAALKIANDKLAAATKAATNAATALAEAQKLAAALPPMLVQAQAAVMPAKVAAEAAAKTVEPAKKALDDANAELDAAKAKVEAMKTKK